MNDGALSATAGRLTARVDGGGGRAARWDPLRSWRDGEIPLLKNLAVGMKVNLLLVVALAVAAVFAVVSANGERQVSRAMAQQSSYRRLGDLAGDIRAEALAMQTAEQEFLRGRRLETVDAHRAAAARIAGLVTELAGLPTAQPLADDIGQLSDRLSGVAAQFETVVATQQTLGLDEESGLRAALLGSVKAIEDELKVWPNQDALWNKMLGMRQAEKDFMLYGGSEHLGKHRKFAMEFDLKIDSSGLPASTAEGFRKLLAAYTRDMAAFAEASTRLAEQGGELRTRMEAARPLIDSLFVYARDGAARAETAEETTRAATLRGNAAAGLLALLVFLGLSMVLSRSIVAPLRLIETTMRRLVAGEHEVTVPGTRRRDEVGDMARAVEVFKENTLAMIRLESEHQALIRNAEVEKKAAMARLADGFEGTVKGVVGAVSSGSLAIAETARSMGGRVDAGGETDSLAVVEAASKAQESVLAARQATDELTASIAEVGRMAGESAEVARDGLQDLGQADGRVAELSAAADEIRSVLALIGQIARQTNLLALNATIEASRAGEAGKGFAVVAGEVKQLAVQTAHATSQIERHVEAIAEVAGGTAQSIDCIGGTIRRLAEITAEVARAMDRQAAATGRIDQCVQAVTEDSRTVSEGVVEVARSAAAYCAGAISILWAANDLAGPVESLQGEVDSFLARVRS